MFKYVKKQLNQGYYNKTVVGAMDDVTGTKPYEKQ